MNWDDLRVFLAVSRAPSIGSAAARLQIDATTVSRRLRRLESDLHATLFEATARGPVLTEAGNRLLVYAENSEQAATQAKSEIAGERNLLSGTVRVSVAEGLGTWLLARHLSEFHAANPSIRIELVATNGFLSPSKREADIAIMLARPSCGPLLAKKLSDYRLKLYASRDYAAQHGVPDCVEALRQRTLVGYIPDFIYAEELRYLDEVADGLEPALASSSINVQYGLVRASAGIGVLPCFIGEQDPHLMRVLDADIAITRSFWHVVHRDVGRLARVRVFADWLAELIHSQRGLLSGSGQ